jgi:glutathione synthase/RimK-type ligase-like ATP-grasp enzyme
MIYIITDRKVIKDYLLLDGTGKIILHHKSKGWPVVDLTEKDVVFPLSVTPFNSKLAIRFNTNEAINNATNKPLSRRILIENNTPVPKTWFNINEAIIPYIARPSFHWLGANFHVVRNEEQHEKLKKITKSDWYFSEIFPTTKEQRVIVFNSRVIHSCSKFFLGDTPEETISKRNQLRREVYRRGDVSILNGNTVEITDEAKDLCIKAVEVLGLDFAGLDLMYDREDNKVICEVNAAPTLGDSFSDKIKSELCLYAASI